MGWSPQPPVEELRAVGDRPPGEGLWAGQEGGAVAALVAHLDTGVDVETQVVGGHLGKNTSCATSPPSLPYLGQGGGGEGPDQPQLQEGGQGAQRQELVLEGEG